MPEKITRKLTDFTNFKKIVEDAVSQGYKPVRCPQCLGRAAVYSPITNKSLCRPAPCSRCDAFGFLLEKEEPDEDNQLLLFLFHDGTSIQN